MDNKETTSETRLNTSNHSKEFWYLNQLKWKIPFDLCENSVYCKKNFFSTFARYIETLKKENTNWWENEIQDFINTVINGGFSSPLCVEFDWMFSFLISGYSWKGCQRGHH